MGGGGDASGKRFSLTLSASARNLFNHVNYGVPVSNLSSNLFGTFTLDFSAWSGLLTALRSLIIALAAFVAYRIIFVGNA